MVALVPRAVGLALLTSGGLFFSNFGRADTTPADERWFQEGIIAYREGRWNEARTALRQAFSAKPRANVAFNLGLTEYKMGLYVEAAQHLAYYIHYEPHPADLERKLLANAESKVGILSVKVNETGASVQVDDAFVGASPLPAAPIYVSPGVHTVRAYKLGFTDSKEVRNFLPGEPVEISLVLGPVRPESDPLRQPEASSSTHIAPQSSASAQKQQPSATPSARTAALIAGSGLTLVSLGVGIVSALRASASNDRVQQLATAIDTQFGFIGCAEGARGICDDIVNERNSRNSQSATSMWAFGVAGLLAASTVGVYFLWPTHDQATTVGLVPSLAPNGGRLSLTGRF